MAASWTAKPLSVEAPASEMYVYYQPDIRAEAPGVRFEVTE